MLIPILFGNILLRCIIKISEESLMPKRFAIYGKAG